MIRDEEHYKRYTYSAWSGIAAVANSRGKHELVEAGANALMHEESAPHRRGEDCLSICDLLHGLKHL